MPNMQGSLQQAEPWDLEVAEGFPLLMRPQGLSTEANRRRGLIMPGGNAKIPMGLVV